MSHILYTNAAYRLIYETLPLTAALAGHSRPAVEAATAGSAVEAPDEDSRSVFAAAGAGSVDGCWTRQAATAGWSAGHCSAAGYYSVAADCPVDGHSPAGCCWAAQVLAEWSAGHCSAADYCSVAGMNLVVADSRVGGHSLDGCTLAGSPDD
jgi:hypothetical protein